MAVKVQCDGCEIQGDIEPSVFSVSNLPAGWQLMSLETSLNKRSFQLCPGCVTKVGTALGVALAERIPDEQASFLEGRMQ